MILVSQTSHLGQAFLAFSLCTVLLQNGAGNNGSRVMNFSSRPSLLVVLAVYYVLEPGTMILVPQTSHLGQAFWTFSLCTVFLEPGTMIPLPCPVIQFTLTSLLIASAVQVCLLACSDQFAFPLVLVSGTGCELLGPDRPWGWCLTSETINGQIVCYLKHCV